MAAQPPGAIPAGNRNADNRAPYSQLHPSAAGIASRGLGQAVGQCRSQPDTSQCSEHRGGSRPAPHPRGNEQHIVGTHVLDGIAALEDERRRIGGDEFTGESRGECGHDDPLARSELPQRLPVWRRSVRACFERQPRRLEGNRMRQGSAQRRIGDALAMNRLAEQEQAQCDRAESCHLTPPEAFGRLQAEMREAVADRLSRR